uniref:Uncharacterized protein n=1 Tax=Cucumis melo TaxID=3656 RepID=A0A9I9D0B3_CUCME
MKNVQRTRKAKRDPKDGRDWGEKEEKEEEKQQQERLCGIGSDECSNEAPLLVSSRSQ